MDKPTRITCDLLPEEVDAVMFAVRFYIDTVNQAHDGEDTSVWWEKRLRLFEDIEVDMGIRVKGCLLYTSPSPRDGLLSRMPSSA